MLLARFCEFKLFVEACFFLNIMKKFVTLLVVAIALSACGDAKKTTNNEDLIDYTVEQFADLQLLRYHVPGFEELSLDQKKLIYSAENLATKKQEIIRLFENANFVLESDNGKTMVFRLRNKFLRLIRTYEDAVTIEYSETPATISGLRKDTLRFSRSIEYLMREQD